MKLLKNIFSQIHLLNFGAICQKISKEIKIYWIVENQATDKTTKVQTFFKKLKTFKLSSNKSPCWKIWSKSAWFLIGLEESPNCLCHFDTESSEHYFLDCFLYSPECQILFNLIEHFIPNFPRLNKKQKHDIILRGVDIEHPEDFPKFLFLKFFKITCCAQQSFLGFIFYIELSLYVQL